jgi:multiple sugar transport system substrate-binding protein
VTPTTTPLEGKLQIFIDAGAAEKYWNTLKAAFQRVNPKVEIEFVVVPWEAYYTKLTTAITAGEAPDIWWVTDWSIQDQILMGAVEDLTPYFETWERKTDVFKGMLEALSWKGRLYGLPHRATTDCFFYRTDHFEEAGIKKFPETWDEFIEVGKMLTVDTDKDGKIDRWGVTYRGARLGLLWLTPLFWQAGGEWIDSSKSFPDNIVINSPQNIRAYEFLASWYKLGIAPPSAPSDTGADMLANFKAEKASIMYAHVGFLGTLKGGQVKFPFDTAQTLKGPVAKMGNAFTDGVVMSSTSKNKKVAWEFLKWMTTFEAQKITYDITGYMPTTVSTTKELLPYITADPEGAKYYPRLFDQLNFVKAKPILPKFGYFQDAWTPDFQAVQLGKMTAKDCLDKWRNDLIAAFKETGAL